MIIALIIAAVLLGIECLRLSILVAGLRRRVDELENVNAELENVNAYLRSRLGFGNDPPGPVGLPQ